MSKAKRLAALLLSGLLLIGPAGCHKEPQKPEGSSGATTAATAGSGTDASADTDASGEVTGGADTSTTSKPGIIRPAGTTKGQTTKKAGTTAPPKPIEIKEDVQNAKFKNLKGTLNIVTSQSNPYEPQIIAEYEAKYGVKVEQKVMGWASFQSQLASMVQAGNPPDVASMTDATSLNWCYGNLAQPLNKYLDLKSPTWNLDDMSQFKIGTNYYGIPLYEYNGFMIYYNKALFKAQKQPDPYTEYYLKGNWTFETFRKVAKAMTIVEGGTVKTQGFATWYFPVFVLASGGSILKEQNRTYVSDLQNPATARGMNFLRDLYMDGSFDYRVRGFTEFGNGKAAMVAERPQNLIGDHDYYASMKDNIGVVPFPKMDKNSKAYAPALMTANFVPNKARNPLAGVAWIYYNHRRAIDGEANGNASVLEQRRRSVSDEHKKIFDDYFKSAVKITTKLEGLTGWSDELRGQFWGEILTESPSNSKSAEEAIAGMENIIKTHLKLTVGG